MFHTRFNRIVSNVIIVGCGGTGSRLIPMVAQFMKNCPAILDPFITLIDGDIVEMKNLTRQNFIKPDVGRNKSEVLAERYGSALEIPVVSIPEYYRYEESPDFCRWLNSFYNKLGIQGRAAGSPLVFFAVDSMVARLEILAGIMYSRFRHSSWGNVIPVIVDAGNENTYGQVSVYHAATLPGCEYGISTRDIAHVGEAMEFIVNTKHNYVGGDLPYMWRPAPVEMMLAALENPSEADVSCADLDQTAAINAQMAVGMFTAFQNICLNHKMPILTSYFDIHNGNSQQKIDEMLLGVPVGKAMENMTVGRNRISKVLREASKRPGARPYHDLEGLSKVLSAGTLETDIRTIFEVQKSLHKAIKDGTITKRNLELEALLNGRAA